jgi:hypothetical protein
MSKKTNLKSATLPPARQAILDHRAAIADAERAHEAALAHRDQLLEIIEGPARTEAEIRRAIAADKTALDEWIRSGEVKTAKRAKVDVARRLGLEDDLETTRHAAEVAEAALDDAEAEVARTAAVLADLNAKADSLNRAAVLDFADALGQEYLRHLDRMVTIYTALSGLDMHLQMLGANGIGTADTALSVPVCSLPSMPFHHLGGDTTREVNDEHARWLADKWGQLGKLWADDPAAPAERVADFANLYLPEV